MRSTGPCASARGSGHGVRADASSVIVPDDLVEAVLSAERIAVRVDDRTRVNEWEQGAAIYQVSRHGGRGLVLYFVDVRD